MASYQWPPPCSPNLFAHCPWVLLPCSMGFLLPAVFFQAFPLEASLFWKSVTSLRTRSPVEPTPLHHLCGPSCNLRFVGGHPSFVSGPHAYWPRARSGWSVSPLGLRIFQSSGRRGHRESTFSSWCSRLAAAALSCALCRSVDLRHLPHTGPMETRHHLVLWKRLSLDSSTLAAVLILRKCFVLLKSYTAAGLTLTRILLFSILSSLISLRFGLMNSVNWLSFPPYLSNPTFLFKLYVHVEENVDEPKGGKMNYNPDTWREAF